MLYLIIALGVFLVAVVAAFWGWIKDTKAKTKKASTKS